MSYTYTITMPTKSLDGKELNEIHEDFVEEVIANIGSCSCVVSDIFVSVPTNEGHRVDFIDTFVYTVVAVDDFDIVPIVSKYCKLCGAARKYVAITKVSSELVALPTA